MLHITDKCNVESRNRRLRTAAGLATVAAGSSFIFTLLLPQLMPCVLSGIALLAACFVWRQTYGLSSPRTAAVQVNGAEHPSELPSYEVLEALYRHSPSGIAYVNEQGEVVRLNGMGEQLLGRKEAELLGSRLRDFIVPEGLVQALGIVEAAMKGERHSFRTALIHKDGYRIDVEATVVPIQCGTKTTGVVLIGQDVTAARRTEEQIRHMAYYDDMTGLPNRRMFLQQLELAMERQSTGVGKVAVLFIDVDRFKLVNDGFGHDYGDMLLLQVAERFTRCLSEHDFMARTEGDEFALYFGSIEESYAHEQLSEIAQSLLQVLEEPFTLGQFQLHITVSIGIAIQSEEENGITELMKGADLALTRAKEKGRNNYQIFNSQMKTASLEKLTMEQELRRAIAKDELVLHYQPQMDIVTESIVGFEALVRWKHPEKGFISPGVFIPFAEESGLIVPLGEWVLKEACRQNMEWRLSGMNPLPVSVNLSTRQFLQPNLIGKIKEVLETTGLPADQLELEITESSTMDVDYAIELLHELKQLGVKISIDDFGTGYSSLYYLKKFPIDKLKIDQSFVRDIMTDPNDAAIVASIIAMTGHLNLKVIAEGVETEDQLQFLHHNHCNEIQGYYFSPPLDAFAIEKLMQARAMTAAAAPNRLPSDGEPVH
ncbi:bifunctional diguanylate cyclase/phosphodiesterase [Paenibacillus sp. YYML68]|uniref:putative bifunctional diguanylate cyclase/phosphodiesterase n=1 Tax=Paenibacillus sp. YYML68 TaxID=2909250 RepID=UPI00248FE80B|nr:EAL domain-containing protein [Paenibacillus sp. YYML68]